MLPGTEQAIIAWLQDSLHTFTHMHAASQDTRHKRSLFLVILFGKLKQIQIL